MLDALDARWTGWRVRAEKARATRNRRGRPEPASRLPLFGMAGVGLISAASLLPWRPGIVEGHSMEPTLSPGRVFLYDRRCSGVASLRRGDIIVLRVQGTPWVKRVYATGGQTFWALRYQGDGEQRLDPIRSSQIGRFRFFARRMRVKYHEGGFSVVQVQVPRGQLFVVGDSGWSWDSRQLGPVSGARLLGRVVACRGADRFPVPEMERSWPTRREAAAYIARLIAQRRTQSVSPEPHRQKHRRVGCGIPGREFAVDL
jgi:signal peptidase I